MSTVSLMLLTWNRASVLEKAMKHSLNNAGHKWDELIWVDNGSEQFVEMVHIMAPYEPTASCFFKKNTGMQRGYNTGMSLCRSKWMILLGCDCLYPDNWLKTFMTYVETIPNTGMASMYSVPIEGVQERYRKSREIEIVNGLPILRAMPMETPCFRRDLFAKVGYWREDFGMYGWGDVEWTLRCERVLTELGLQYYVIPNQIYQHLGSEGATEFKPDNGDTREYWEWKKQESNRPENHDIMEKCRQENYPFYSPF